MTGWEITACVGLGLGMVGSAIAVYGVWQLARGLSVPWASPVWLGRFQSWWRQRILRRAPRVLTAGGTSSITFEASGRLSMKRRRPDGWTTATMTEVLDYIDQRADDLAAEIAGERDAREEQRRKDLRAMTEAADNARQIAEAEVAKLNVALAGERGNGLKWAAFGLILTFVGGGLQVAAVALA